MIEEREARAARYREQRAREEIEQQRANMIKGTKKFKRTKIVPPLSSAHPHPPRIGLLEAPRIEIEIFCYSPT